MKRTSSQRRGRGRGGSKKKKGKFGVFKFDIPLPSSDEAQCQEANTLLEGVQREGSKVFKGKLKKF